jgi:hypothetical protein
MQTAILALLALMLLVVIVGKLAVEILRRNKHHRERYLHVKEHLLVRWIKWRDTVSAFE